MGLLAGLCSGDEKAREASYPGCFVEPELLPSMVVQEVHKGWRQRVRLANPRIANLHHDHHFQGLGCCEAP